MVAHERIVDDDQQRFSCRSTTNQTVASTFRRAGDHWIFTMSVYPRMLLAVSDGMEAQNCSPCPSASRMEPAPCRQQVAKSATLSDSTSGTQYGTCRAVSIGALRARTACDMTRVASLIAAWIPEASVKRYAVQLTP